jgi:hypothetical protein
MKRFFMKLLGLPMSTLDATEHSTQDADYERIKAHVCLLQGQAFQLGNEYDKNILTSASIISAGILFFGKEMLGRLVIADVLILLAYGAMAAVVTILLWNQNAAFQSRQSDLNEYEKLMSQSEGRTEDEIVNCENRKKSKRAHLGAE